jgi:hypothetical protein
LTLKLKSHILKALTGTPFFFAQPCLQPHALQL